MKEEKLKEAFQKIREDMDFFHQEIEYIKRTLEELKEEIKNSRTKTTQHQIQTTQHQIQTTRQPENTRKGQNQHISIGNEGVQTTQQTTQQTTRHPIISTPNDKISQLKKVSDIISSLDDIKQEVRVKFKKLTNSEMLIFTTIYQLEEQGITPDYSLLAERLSLSESSIRDYIRRIIKKGVPLDKIQDKTENNRIKLKISPDLKQIASLNTILQLREL